MQHVVKKRGMKYVYLSDGTKYANSRPVVECAQCGKLLFIPEWSEHVDDRRVRHLWNCEPCSYSFETTVVFPAVAQHDCEVSSAQPRMTGPLRMRIRGFMKPVNRDTQTGRA